MVILEGPAVPVRRQVAAVGLGAVGATVLGVLSFPLLWAAYHAALATGLSRPVAEPLCTAVLAVVFIVEARGMIRSSRNAATARRVRLIHEPGAEYWEASCLVAAPDGISAGRLCRNLLQWTDAHQVGLVASAASPHLAQRYSRLGFSPVEGYPEQILRRPPAECRPAPARSGRRRLPQRTC
jgi:hypothetical protein